MAKAKSKRPKGGQADPMVATLLKQVEQLTELLKASGIAIPAPTGASEVPKPDAAAYSRACRFPEIRKHQKKQMKIQRLKKIIKFWLKY